MDHFRKAANLASKSSAGAAATFSVMDKESHQTGTDVLNFTHVAQE